MTLGPLFPNIFSIILSEVSNFYDGAPLLKLVHPPPEDNPGSAPARVSILYLITETSECSIENGLNPCDEESSGFDSRGLWTMNECSISKPCLNSGICTDKINGYSTCTCVAGFTGKNCQISEFDCMY